MSRTRAQKVSLAMKMLSHFNSFPISIKAIAKRIGCRPSEIYRTVEKLERTGLIIQSPRKSYARTWKLKENHIPSEEAVEEEFRYLETRNRIPIRLREGTNEVKDLITKRKCRDCQQFLPQSRYFRCYSCQPELPLEDDDFLFQGVGDEGITEDLGLYNYYDDESSNFFEEDIVKLASTIPKEELD